MICVRVCVYSLVPTLDNQSPSSSHTDREDPGEFGSLKSLSSQEILRGPPNTDHRSSIGIRMSIGLGYYAVNMDDVPTGRIRVAGPKSCLQLLEPKILCNNRENKKIS